MRHLIRGRLGQVIVSFVIVAAAVALAIGVSRMAYPTVGTYADATGSAAKVELDATTKRPQLTLTEDAANRLGVRTGSIAAAPAGTAGTLVMPTAALFYDQAGDTWAYVASQPLVFERQHVTVSAIQGDTATLSAGPPAGTQVVTVGAAELYGTEVGVGEE